MCFAGIDKGKSKLHPRAYEAPPPKYLAETLLKILLNPHIDTSRICHEWPIPDISASGSFVVDVMSLKHPDDVKKDFFGKWTHTGSHPFTFKAHIKGDDYVQVEKCAPGASGDVFYLRRLHSYHPSNPEFWRMIAYVSGMLIREFYQGSPQSQVKAKWRCGLMVTSRQTGHIHNYYYTHYVYRLCVEHFY